MGNSTEAVVLMNLGAPENEAAVRAYIISLLSDPDVMPLPWPMRNILAVLIAGRRFETVASRYRSIGGRSPLSARTREQVEAVKKLMGAGINVRYAFRHSKPRANGVLKSLKASGVKRIVAVPMYPQWSFSTSGSAVKDILSAGSKNGVEVAVARSFPDSPGFIEAMADLTRPHISSGSHLIFCAHGLPLSLIRRGDKYLDEVKRTVDAIKAQLPSKTPGSTAFQSRVGRMEWTGPNVKDEIKRLANDGVRSLVVVPISFVCENLETLYELDIELKDFARGLGIEDFSRVPAPGTHPAFINGLARLISETHELSGWEEAKDDS